MDLPKSILDFLVYLAPSLLVLLTAWLTLKKLIDREHKLQLIQVKMSSQKETLPLRLQAYERLCLYLERISPNVLLINEYKHNATVHEFQLHLIEIIRSEFEHNFTQQLYVSSALWTIVRNSKEEVIRLINASASSLDGEAPSYQLSKRIFDTMLQNEEFPTQRALLAVKNEISQIF